MEAEFTIQDKAWNKIMNYANAAYNQFKSEIGGMMVAIQDENNDWELKDPVIMKQQISAGNTHLDKDALAEYYTTAAMKYKKCVFRFCWWHSHHTMGAFWSGTDVNTIDEFNEGDFSFALVVNLKQEYKFRVSVWKPIEVHEDVDLNIEVKGKTVPKQITEEVIDLCARETITTNRIGYGTRNGYTNNYNQSNLFHERQEERETIFAKLYKHIDELHYKVSGGELTYANYINKVKAINVALAQEGSGLQVKESTKKELEDNLLVDTPMEYIIDDNNDDLDVMSWNAGFGL